MGTDYWRLETIFLENLDNIEFRLESSPHFDASDVLTGFIRHCRFPPPLPPLVLGDRKAAIEKVV